MNLERQVKRHLLAKLHRAVIRPGPGCLPAVEAEIEELLGGLATPGEVRATIKSGSDGILVAPIRYRSLLEIVMRLTTAQDVSLVVGEGAVHNRADLETLVERIDWQFFLRDGDRVHLRCDSRASTLYHEGIIRETVTARLERSRVPVVKGYRLEGTFTVEVRIVHNRCRVLLSLAGDPLWKRGYRESSYARAPLREDLAQSAIHGTLKEAEVRRHDPSQSKSHGWVADVLFVPFSGSGTLLLEFLIDRYGIPPFVFREYYAFERFAVPLPPSVAWVKGKLLDSLTAYVSHASPLVAQLVDRDERAITAATENLRRFESLLSASRSGLVELPVDVECTPADVFARPWRSWLPSASKRVFLPMNPPYGVRLATRSAEELYRRLGDATAELAAGLPGRGLRGFILCPSERSWKAFLGAVPRLDHSTSHFSQGGLDIRLCRFRS